MKRKVKANGKTYLVSEKFTPEIAQKALKEKMLNGAKLTKRQTNLIRAISKLKPVKKFTIIKRQFNTGGTLNQSESTTNDLRKSLQERLRIIKNKYPQAVKKGSDTMKKLESQINQSITSGDSKTFMRLSSQLEQELKNMQDNMSRSDKAKSYFDDGGSVLDKIKTDHKALSYDNVDELWLPFNRENVEIEPFAHIATIEDYNKAIQILKKYKQLHILQRALKENDEPLFLLSDLPLNKEAKDELYKNKILGLPYRIENSEVEDIKRSDGIHTGFKKITKDSKTKYLDVSSKIREKDPDFKDQYDYIWSKRDSLQNYNLTNSKIETALTPTDDPEIPTIITTAYNESIRKIKTYLQTIENKLKKDNYTSDIIAEDIILKLGKIYDILDKTEAPNSDQVHLINKYITEIKGLEKQDAGKLFDIGSFGKKDADVQFKEFLAGRNKINKKPQSGKNSTNIEELEDGEYGDISGLLSGVNRFLERATTSDEDQKITPVVKSKIQEKPTDTSIKEFYELLGTAKDKSGKLHSFKRTFDNEIGGRMIPLPKLKELGSKDTVLTNVSGVGHFIMDGDITPNQKYTKPYKTSKGDVISSNYSDMFMYTDVSKPESYVAQYKPEPSGEYRVRYKQLKDIKGVDFSKKDYIDDEGYETKLGVRSHKFTDVDWDNSGKSTGYQISSKYVPTKDKNKSTSIVTTGKNNYSRFGGGSITYLFKDKNGKSIGIDVAGSPTTLKEQGLSIIKEYGIKPEDLSFTYHDMGSYSAKPMANAKGELSSAQWRNYNQYNKGYSGAALVFPKYKKGSNLFKKNSLIFHR